MGFFLRSLLHGYGFGVVSGINAIAVIGGISGHNCRSIHY
jgi:hypothetical protein